MKLLKNKPFGKRKQVAYTSIPSARKLIDTDTGGRTVAFCFEGTDGYVYTVTLTYEDIAILEQAYNS